MLHFGGLQAETRAARWNEALPDEALSLPLAAAPGGNEELCVPLGPGEAAALKDKRCWCGAGTAPSSRKQRQCSAPGGGPWWCTTTSRRTASSYPWPQTRHTRPRRVPAKDGRRWAARLAELRGDASAALLRVPSPRCSEAAREVVDTAAGDDAVGSFYDAGRLGCDVWRS
ncbi:unnamed protein product, partial [Prorocentrum cordatum]